MSDPGKKTFSGKLFEGVVWVSIGAFGIRVVGFLVSVFLLRAFSLRDYGTYQLVLAAGSIFALFMLQGVDEVIVAAGARSIGLGDRVKAHDLMRGYWLFKIGTGLVAFIVIMAYSGRLSLWYSADILQLLRQYAWVFLVIPFERTVLFYLSIHRRFVALSAYTLVQEILKGLLIVGFVYYAHLGIRGVLYAMVAAMAVTALLFCRSTVLAMLEGIRSASFEPFLVLLHGQGLWVIGQRFVRQGEKNLRPFIIQALLGRDAVALFSFAQKIYSYVSGTFPIDDVLMPTIASEMDDKERLQRILERGIKYAMPFYTVLALLVSIISPIVIGAVFPQYISGIPLLYAVMFYVPFVGLAYILSAFYVSHQQQESVFWIMCFRFLFFVVFLPIFVRLFGLVGIGIEFTVTLIVSDLLRFVILLRKYPHLHVRLDHLLRYDSYDRAVISRIGERLSRFRLK